jgi:FkbM family methyltransferase
MFSSLRRMFAESVRAWVFKKNSGFLFRFRLINVFRWRKEIKISLEDEGIWKISEKNKKSVWVARATRIPYFMEGFSVREKKLLLEYQVANISFSKNDIVIDCGANIGEFTMSLQKRFGIRAICIEPESREVVALKKNADLQCTHVYETVLWKEKTNIPFYSANDTGDSSAFPVEDGIPCVVRQAVTLDDVVLNDSFFKDQKRIALLKLEAEGAEPEILEGAKKILRHIRYITADCGAERGIKKESTLIPVMNILQKYGFEPVSFGLPRAVMVFKNKS